MATVDIVFLHPPSIYDFRRRQINYGLMATTVSASSVFETFPVGFLSLSHALREAHYRTRILNLATLMLFDESFDVPEYLASISTRYFGLSLHWVVHAQGFLEVARIIRRVQPGVPIIVGGITATYYRDELIRLPEVDYVIAGDSAEAPLVELLRRLDSGADLEVVPNLSWKVHGRVCHSVAIDRPEAVNVRYDYRILLEELIESGRPEQVMMTAENSMDSFATMIPFVRGCKLRCRSCGGSNFAMGRKMLGLRSVESVVRDIEAAKELQSKTISVYGDLRQGDWKLYLALLSDAGIGRALRYELYWKANPDFIHALGRASPAFTMMISPESHDEDIRRRMGRGGFTNETLESTINYILEVGGDVRLFFLIGCPGQDRDSIHRTLDYIDSLLAKYSACRTRSVDANIGPLAPFIDPGSPSFENPEAFGYRLKFRSLREHIAAGYEQDWRCMFNYESRTLPIDELAAVSWDAARRLTQIRLSHGLIQSYEARAVDARLAYCQEWEKQTPAFREFLQRAQLAPPERAIR